MLKVDPASSTSIYRQICEQVKYAIASGELAPGDRLPTIRQVAAKTRVNRNTIARSYSELERSGVIVSRPGQGSFVAPAESALQKRERLRILEEMIRKLLVEAYHLQITPSELHELYARVEQEIAEEEKKTP